MKIKIGRYEWKAELANSNDKDLEDKYDGRCCWSSMRIVVRKDLDAQMIKETLLHELTHAYLGMQGRYKQTKFTTEEVCEFIGWNIESILETANTILKGWKVGK